MQDVSIQEALFHLGLRWDFSRQDYERARDEAKDERSYVWWEMILPYAIARAKVWSEEEPVDVVELDDDYELVIELDIGEFESCEEYEFESVEEPSTSLGHWAARHLDGVEQGIVTHQPALDLGLLASLVRHHEAGDELLELWVEASMVQPELRDAKAFVLLAALMGSRRKMDVFRRVVARYADFARRTTYDQWGDRIARELQIAQNRFHVGVLIQICDGLVDPLLATEFEGFVATDEELEQLVKYCPELSHRLGLTEACPQPRAVQSTAVITMIVMVSTAIAIWVEAPSF